MLKVSNKYANANNASVRRFKAKVEVYANNALAFTYTQNDALKSISIERLGADSKFFGFGISTKMNIHLRDVLREINISTANTLKIYIGIVEAGDIVEYLSFPVIHVTEVNRDENTNELSITGYDVLEYSKGRTVSELNLTAPYTIGTFIAACGNLLGVNTSFTSELSNVIEINYPDGANFEGTENIRDALTSAAEAIQAIYYIDGYNQLTVKRLSKNGDPVKTISRDDYITLDSGNNRRLQTICHTTELGDNVSASTTQIGTTQYVRDNPFWELRDDIATLVNDALEAVGDMTINQFECNWRGCLALEPGDKIKLITKDNKSVISYVLNDTLTYNGGLTQKTQWNYTESENTESNATSLGDCLKEWLKTIAIVVGTFIVVIGIQVVLYLINAALYTSAVILFFIFSGVYFTKQIHDAFAGEVYTTVTPKDLMYYYLQELGGNEDIYNKEEKENLARLIIELSRYNQLHNNPANRIKLMYKSNPGD